MILRQSILTCALTAALLAACSSSTSDGKTVKDQAGRTCTIPSSGSLTISCDATPMPKTACAGGATACFTKGVSSTGGVGSPQQSAVCAGCCSGNTSVSNGADCSPIVCKTVDDCPRGDTKCENGRCY